jgi:hypothetical protein
MPESKTPAPDPEIPDELRVKVAKAHRPAGFAPKSPEAEDDNAKEETPPPQPMRDTTQFFAKLAEVLKNGTFCKIVIEEREVKQRIPGSRSFKLVRKKVEIEVEVALRIGEDGLPYVDEPVSSEETRRVRNLSYPDAPKCPATYGDLWPDFVEWLYLNHPYDAAVRYAARNTHVQIAAMDRVAS